MILDRMKTFLFTRHIKASSADTAIKDISPKNTEILSYMILRRLK